MENNEFQQSNVAVIEHDINEITDIQFLKREFPDVPTYNVCTKDFNKYEAYNMTNDDKITLASAIDEYNKTQEGDFKFKVMGYSVGNAEFPNRDINGNITQITQTVLHLYLSDKRVLFITARTAIRNFFDIVSKFGLPSDNEGLELSVSLKKNS